MSIRQPSPSPRIRSLAQRVCRDVSPTVLRSAPGKLNQVRATLRAAHPLKVYLLGTLALVERATLDAARPVAWRFLILRGQRPVAATEITLEESERGARWMYTSYDSRHRRQLQTIERMLSNPSHAGKRYELRFLRIPGLDLNALLWLHSADGADDRIVHLGASHMLRAGWQYPAEKALARLRPHAERRRRPNPATSRRPSGSTNGSPQTGPLIEIQPAIVGGPSSLGGEG